MGSEMCIRDSLSSDWRLYLPIDGVKERWQPSPNHSAKIRLFFDSTKFRVVIRADFQQLSNCKLVNNYKS